MVSLDVKRNITRVVKIEIKKMYAQRLIEHYLSASITDFTSEEDSMNQIFALICPDSKLQS